mmetsp:Transcript_1720/g.2243  ORF Transcript_1720/g.2243 Transcript_1720/m.2243 type:complete len:621 (-) Transcript_1720:36-1898(-)
MKKETALVFFVAVLPALAFVVPIKESSSSVILQGKKSKNKNKSDNRKKNEAKFVESSTQKYAFTLANLKKTTPDGRKVLDGIDLAFFHGAKIGVVGNNGCGKSTLMKIMAGLDKDYEGIVEAGNGLSVGYLPQEPLLQGEIVDDAILPAIQKSKDILNKFEEISAQLATGDGDIDSLMEELGQVQDEIDAGDLWELDRKIELSLDALQCPPRDAKLKYLSGGERRRVAIARLLLENPDLLLLDEPTNHLDEQSCAWLEDFLADFKGTVVLITHDRYFLERVTKWILEIDNGKGLPFEGSYAQWLEYKAEQLAPKKNTDAPPTGKRLALLNELRAFADRANDNRPAKQRLAAYDSLLSAETPKQPDAMFIPSGPRLGTDVLQAEDLCLKFGQRTLFQDLSFEIQRGSIVGICGPVGAGKTSLCKALLGEIEPTSGNVHLGSTVVLATAAQSRDMLDARGPDATVFEAITDGLDYVKLGDTQIQSRQYVGWFGFSGSAQQKPISVLSGGERNRAFLARQLRANANFLFLDEPSNDLDVSTLRSLEDALLKFAGTALVVSHDRFFLDRICTHIIAFEVNAQGTGSDVVFFQGNYAEYDANRRDRLGDALPRPIRFNRNQLIAA